MQNLPPFIYAKAFWEALTFAVAGLLALLAFFGVVDSSWAVPSTVLLTWILALLKMFRIEPELRARMLMAEMQATLNEAKRLLAETKKVKSAK